MPSIVYPGLLSSIAPVPLCSELPVPTLSKREQSSSEENSNSEEDEVLDPDYGSEAEERNPYYPNQKDLNDQIRDLDLTKFNAELLTSRLNENLLDESVQVISQRKRHQSFSSFFSCRDDFASVMM